MDLAADGRYDLTALINDAGVVVCVPPLPAEPQSFRLHPSGALDIQLAGDADPIPARLLNRAMRMVRAGVPLAVYEADPETGAGYRFTPLDAIETPVT